MVQGVWFRDSCRHQALQMRVSGLVRNLEDGRVEAIFEGSPDAVSSMCNWCQDGPPRARVDHVRILDEEPAGLLGFRVR